MAVIGLDSRRYSAAVLSMAAIAALAGSARGQVTLLNSWGSPGSGGGQFDLPEGVSVDPLTGTVYVADSFNSRIETFTSTGAYLSTIGGPGSGAGQFLDAVGVSFDPVSRNFAVVDLNAGDVQVFQPGNSTPISVFGSPGAGGGQLSFPAGLDYLNGDVYVADSGNNRISEFTAANGAYLDSQSGLQTPTTFNHPDGVAVDPVTGKLTVADTDNDRVIKFDAINGEGYGALGTLGSGAGQFNLDDAITDTGSRVYVCDEQNGRVQVFDESNNFLTSFAVNSPQGVAVNSNGMVYVSSGNSVKRFFDPGAWTTGVNSFTDSTIGPTSVAVGTGQFLGAQLNLGSTKGLIAGGAISVVTGGTLTLSGGTLSAPQIAVSGGGVLSATAGGSVNLNTQLSISGAGSQIVLDGGVVATTLNTGITGGLLKIGNATLNNNGGLGYEPQFFMSSGALQLNDPAHAVVISQLFNTSGLIDGTGGQLEGTVLNSGTIAVMVGASFTFAGSSNTNSGTIATTSTSALHFTHDLTNESNGTITMSGGSFMIDGGLTNNGDFEMLGASQVSGAVINGSGATFHTIGIANSLSGMFTNNGTVNCQSGVLFFAGGYTGPGGVGGLGRVTLDQAVSTGAAPATVTFGGSVLMQPTMVLSMRLAGTTPDKITIAGTGTLNGTLQIDSYNGTPPLPGQSFQAITFGSKSGDIALSNQTGFAGLRFAKSYTSGALDIAVSGLAGDANLDGTVNSQDFAVLAAHYGASGNWLAGNFNGDNVVNALDFNALATNYGQAMPSSSLGVVVPEPLTLGGWLFPLMCLRSRSRFGQCKS